MNHARSTRAVCDNIMQASMQNPDIIIQLLNIHDTFPHKVMLACQRIIENRCGNQSTWKNLFSRCSPTWSVLMDWNWQYARNFICEKIDDDNCADVSTWGVASQVPFPSVPIPVASKFVNCILTSMMNLKGRVPKQGASRSGFLKRLPALSAKSMVQGSAKSTIISRSILQQIFRMCPGNGIPLSSVWTLLLAPYVHEVAGVPQNLFYKEGQ